IFHVNLGTRAYLSTLREVDAIVGNSSSGIIEAPALKKPTVNIGDRQRGRLRAPSVLDCPEDATAIRAALERALSSEFRDGLAQMVSPYGSPGLVAPAIVDVLRRVDTRSLLRKTFFDSSETPRT